MGARARVGTWVRACRGVGAGVSTFSRANHVCRATNRYQGSVYGTHSYHLFIPPNSVLEQDHVLRSEEEHPKVIRNLQRTDPLLVCRLQSRRWLRRHADQSVQKFLTKAHSRLHRHVGVHKLLMHAVPRMRLRSSLSTATFVPRWTTPTHAWTPEDDNHRFMLDF